MGKSNRVIRWDYLTTLAEGDDDVLKHLDELWKVVVRGKKIDFSLVPQVNFDKLRKTCRKNLLSPASKDALRKASLSFHKMIFGDDEQLLYAVDEILQAIESADYTQIRAVKERILILRDATINKTVDPFWFEMLMRRAITRPDGWISVWAIEHCLEVGVQQYDVFRKDFFPSFFVSNLEKNDVFWRFHKMNKFEAVQKALVEIFNSIVSNEKRLRMLFESLNSLTCVHTLLAISYALRDVKLNPVIRYVTDDDVRVMEDILPNRRNVVYPSVRIVTMRNILLFYAKVTKMSEFLFDLLADFASPMCQDCSTEFVMSFLFVDLEEIVKESKFTLKIQSMKEYVYEKGEELTDRLKLCYPNFPMRCYMSYVPLSYEQRAEVIIELSAQIANAFLAEPDSDEYKMMPALTYLYMLHPPKMAVKDEPSLLDWITPGLRDRIVKLISENKGEVSECYVIPHILRKLYNRYCRGDKEWCSKNIKTLTEAAVNNMKNDQMYNNVMTLGIHAMMSEATKNQRSSMLMVENLRRFLGKTLKQQLAQKVFYEGPNSWRIEYRKMKRTIHLARIDLISQVFLAKCKPIWNNTDLQLLFDELRLLSNCDTVKIQLIANIKELVRIALDPDQALRCIEACDLALNTIEKHYNIAHHHVISMILLAKLDENQSVVPKYIQLLEKYLDSASSGRRSENNELKRLTDGDPFIACSIADSFFGRFKQTENMKWAPLLLKMALFKVHKDYQREQENVYHSYTPMFANEKTSDTLPVKVMLDSADNRHEMSVKARFVGCLVVLRITESLKWMERITTDIRNNQSKDNYVKKRALELILLLTSRVNDTVSTYDQKPWPTIVWNMFDYCLDRILEMNQLDNVRILAEWTIARLCISVEKIKEKVMSDEFEKMINSKRPAALASLIHILVLLTRSTLELNTDLLIDKFIRMYKSKIEKVRSTALAAVRLLLENAKTEKQEQVNTTFTPLQTVDEYAEKLSQDVYFTKFMPIDNFTLDTIFWEVPNKCGMVMEEVVPINVIESVTEDKVVKFKNTFCEVTCLTKDKDILAGHWTVFKAKEPSVPNLYDS